jgi:hypothetical protein
VAKATRQGPSHPFCDEREVFEKLPKLKLSDLFGS